LRLEVKYPDKPAHEVEVKVTMVVLGRDPSCDIVINDERCSRRHAVIEMTPTGLQVRDSGSANGIFVNGKKMERSPLAQGDLVRLGEVIIKVLPEEQPGTLVMATDEIVDLGPAPAVPAKAAGPSALDGDALARRPAPRPLQAVIAGLGLLVCPFTLASATTLIYALRPGTRAVFGDARAGAVGAAESAELTFALTLIGTVILGSALCLTGGLFARFAR
jgi:hypothetical protein